MKIMHIIISIMFSISILCVAIDMVLFTLKKRKDNKTHVENENGEICVLCGRYMGSETGRMYCRECAKKWGNLHEDNN